MSPSCSHVVRTLGMLLVTVVTAGAQPTVSPADNALLPSERLQEDLRIARRALTESQVGLTWFQTQRAFDAGFSALERELVVPMSRTTFHHKLAPLIAALRHGHVTLERAIPSVGFRTRFLDSTARYLPFALRVVDSRVFVVADLSGAASLSRGDELLSIDGTPVHVWLTRMAPYLSADGRNASFKRYQLGTYFRFHELLALLAGPSDTSRITVLTTTRGPRRSASRFVAVRNASPSEMQQRYAVRVGQPLDRFPPAVALSFPERGTARLAVSSFYEGLLPKEAGDFPAAFARSFRAIADSGVTDLIIDLRGNEGGNGEYVPMLFRYLTTRPFDVRRRTVVAGLKASWLPYATDVSEEVKAFAASPENFVDQTPDGLWVLKAQFDSVGARSYVPDARPFTGRLFIVTDGGSFSATNAFIALAVAERARGARALTFVGEEHGGDLRSGRVSGGTQQTLVLPHSGERLTLALTGVVPLLGEQAESPRMPDRRTQPSGQDIAAGTDRVLVTVMDMIRAARHR